MTNKRVEKSTFTVGDFVAAMASIADPALAQPWDNVGLLAGDPSARVDRVLACIDLTPSVVDEVIQGKFDLVLAYHPPVFRPILSLRADSRQTDALVYRCIRAGVAIYAIHTALDAAPGGTNDLLAEFCGVTHTEPLEYVDRPGIDERKLVVTIPAEHTDAVANAMFAAGAGHIGDYSHCSFRASGQGSFLGSDTTNPAVGQRGRLEFVDEIRLEAVVPAKQLPQVVFAMVAAHPYEEPAFDIYPLQPRPLYGIGRVGRLTKPTSLATLARSLKAKTKAKNVTVVGLPEQQVQRAIVVVGSAGSLPFRASLGQHDVIVTGEIRHHDALSIERTGASAIALGHWTSERPILAQLVTRIEQMDCGIEISISTADHEPFTPI